MIDVMFKNTQKKQKKSQKIERGVLLWLKCISSLIIYPPDGEDPSVGSNQA